MTGIDSIVNEPAVQAIGWALVHFVWQGTLIALIAAGALRLMCAMSSPRLPWR